MARGRWMESSKGSAFGMGVKNLQRGRGGETLCT